MKKLTAGILLVAIIFALCLSGCTQSGPKVPVMSVSEIIGIGPVGMTNRYGGVVEAGETVNIEKDANMEIKEISVSVGDAVSKGQALFSYQTDALSIEIEQMQLEVEQMNNNITTKKSQITALEKEQKTAASADKLQYTLQIQQLQIDVKEAEFNVTAKKKEIDRSKAKLSDANVLSPVAGHVKSVNSGNSDVDPMTGQPLPFMTITEEGDFRVKGTVNETNAANFYAGMPVILRSRTDETAYWTGTVTLVDFENPISGNNNNMMYSGTPTDEMTTTSKYPFYVKLNGDEGLMLGQHVFIEPDNGQTADGDSDTFYLPSFYICDLDAEPWVWAANEKDKLEKRPVMLGNYNIDMDSYEIMEGLTLEDFIAFPEETCTEGAKVRYPGEEEEVVDESEGGGEALPEGELPENGEIPENGDIIGGEDEPMADDFIDKGITAEPVPTNNVAVPTGVAVTEETEAVG